MWAGAVAVAMGSTRLPAMVKDASIRVNHFVVEMFLSRGTARFHGSAWVLRASVFLPSAESGWEVQYGRECRKTLQRLLTGASDAAIRFDDLCVLLEDLGFEKRVRGSHHLFRKAGVEERLNLQRDGSHAKTYQVKQVRAVVQRYRLGDGR